MNKPTRFYSNRQEKAVAKKVGGKQVVNSGATAFSKGDVRTEEWIIECKTSTKEKSSFCIKREWLEKNKEEAFAMGKSFGALCFDFGGTKRYYVVDEKTFIKMKQALENLQEEISMKPKANVMYECKNDVLGKMQWLKKDKSCNRSQKDVSISLNACSTSTTGRVIAITFRNECYELVSDTGYIQAGVYKNRCFFRSTTSSEGYKLSCPKAGLKKSRYCKMPEMKELANMIGDYELKYDDFLEMYYIEKEV